MDPNIGLILLAAGGSSRMGSPKQLLPYQGRTLLRHAIELATATPCRPVIVVLGKDAEQLWPEAEGLPVRIAVNNNWEAGIGSSIRLGIRSLIEDRPSINAALILLADQPLAGPQAVTALIDHFQASRPLVVASEYAGTVGVPALFARDLFPSLLSLADGDGAKRVILSVGAAAHRLPLPEAAWDIDTPEDFARLQQRP